MSCGLAVPSSSRNSLGRRGFRDRLFRRAFVALLGGVVFFLADAAVPQVEASAQSNEAAREYKLGKGHYDLGLTDRAIPHFERVRELAGAGSGDISDAQREQVLFLLGECYFVAGTLDRAAERYGELTGQFPKSKYRGDAWVRAAECWGQAQSASRSRGGGRKTPSGFGTRELCGVGGAGVVLER